MTEATSRVTTPIGRVSFPKLWTPEVNDQGVDVYSVTLIFEPDTDFTEMERILDEAIAKSKKWKTTPSYIIRPFRKGVQKTADAPRGFDLAQRPEYAGKIILTLNSQKIKPGVVDRNNQYITNESDVYAGCYGRARVTAYTYIGKSGPGVTFSLQNFQKTHEGEPLGVARVAADEDFAAMPIPDGDNGDMLGLDDLGV